jgi:hypothetical protein
MKGRTVIATSMTLRVMLGRWYRARRFDHRRVSLELIAGLVLTESIAVRKRVGLVAVTFRAGAEFQVLGRKALLDRHCL